MKLYQQTSTVYGGLHADEDGAFESLDDIFRDSRTKDTEIETLEFDCELIETYKGINIYSYSHEGENINEGVVCDIDGAESTFIEYTNLKGAKEDIDQERPNYEEPPTEMKAMEDPRWWFGK